MGCGGWVTRGFIRDSPWEKRVTLFSKNDHPLDILFFFILSFLFFFSFKYKIIPIITSLNRREGYNLSYIYYIYMVWIE